MKVSGSKRGVVGDFGKDVWKKIGRAYLRSIIKLRAQRFAESGWKSDKSPYELIRILNAHSHRPMVVWVIGDTKLRRAGVRETDPDVLVFVVGDCQIGGHWAQSS